MFTIRSRRSLRVAWLLTAAIAATGVLAACHDSNPQSSPSGVPEPAAPPTPAGPLTPAAPPGQTSDANAPQAMPTPTPMPADQSGYAGAPPTYAAPGYAGAPPTYGGAGPAYTSPPPAYEPVAAPAVQVVAEVPLLSDQQLDDLLAPMALYPDPLIAEMLPAATYPDELAIAAQWLAYNPAPADYAIEAQPWDASIKALAHSPSVLVWMNNNPDWTHTLGVAFTYQPQDVMNSIQRLRAEALAAGSLIDTPQQVIVEQDRVICIEPAVTNVIYVPVYDWHVVYVHHDRRPEFNFYVGCNIGGWLDNDCDWGEGAITIGAHWDRGWDHRWDGDRNARATHVSVTRRSVVNNRTVINNNTSNNTRVVQVGGTPWKRDAARPLPALPPSVRPAKSAGRMPATPRDNVAPTTPRGEALPTPRGTSVRTPGVNPSARPAVPNPSARPAVPNPSARPATPNPSVRPPNPRGAAEPNPSIQPPNPRGMPTPNPSVQTPTPRGGAEPTPNPRANTGKPPTPVTPPNNAGRGRTPEITPATPAQPPERGRGETGNDRGRGVGNNERGQPRPTPPAVTPDRRLNNARGNEVPPVTPPTLTPATPGERGAERGRGPEAAPPPTTPPAGRGPERGRGSATQGDRGGRGG